MSAYLNEISTIIIAVVAGGWTIFKSMTYAYDKLQTRIDRLERETITRQEVQEFATEIRKSMQSQQDHIDKKLDGLNENIVKLMLRDRYHEQNQRGPGP